MPFRHPVGEDDIALGVVRAQRQNLLVGARFTPGTPDAQRQLLKSKQAQKTPAISDLTSCDLSGQVPEGLLFDSRRAERQEHPKENESRKRDYRRGCGVIFLALRLVGPKSGAESVHFHGRRLKKEAWNSNVGFSGLRGANPKKPNKVQKFRLGDLFTKLHR
jgi:hypothetical protein